MVTDDQPVPQKKRSRLLRTKVLRKTEAKDLIQGKRKRLNRSQSFRKPVIDLQLFKQDKLEEKGNVYKPPEVFWLWTSCADAIKFASCADTENDDDATALEMNDRLLRQFQALFKKAKHQEHHLHETQEWLKKQYQFIFDQTKIGFYCGANQEVIPSCFTFEDDEITMAKVLSQDDVVRNLAEWCVEKDATHTAWLAEFFDLILVACVVKLTNNLKYNVKYAIYADHSEDITMICIDGFVVYFDCFVLFMTHSFLLVRFKMIQSPWIELFQNMYGAGLMQMFIFVPATEKMFVDPAGLFNGWELSLLSIVLLNTFFYFHTTKLGKQCAIKRIIAAALGMIIAIGTVVGNVNESVRSWFFLFSGIPLFIVEIFSAFDPEGEGDAFLKPYLMSFFDMTNYARNDLEFLEERFCIFAMIFMGESVLALVLTDPHAMSEIISDGHGGYIVAPSDSNTDFKVALEVISVVLVGFVLIYQMFIMYFHGSYEINMLYLLVHLPMGFALIIIALTFKITFYFITDHVSDEAHEREYKVWTSSLLFWALAMMIICVWARRNVVKGHHHHEEANDPDGHSAHSAHGVVEEKTSFSDKVTYDNIIYWLGWANWALFIVLGYMEDFFAKRSIVTTMIVSAIMLVLTVWADLTTIKIEHADSDMLRSKGSKKSNVSTSADAIVHVHTTGSAQH